MWFFLLLYLPVNTNYSFYLGKPQEIFLFLVDCQLRPLDPPPPAKFFFAASLISPWKIKNKNYNNNFIVTSKKKMAEEDTTIMSETEYYLDKIGALEAAKYVLPRV